MNIKIITIQVAHSNNKTIGYGYDASLYESEEKLFENLSAEFEDDFAETVEFASLTYKLNDDSMGTFMLDTSLTGESLVASIKAEIEN